jgi:hypothetical protein
VTGGAAGFFIEGGEAMRGLVILLGAGLAAVACAVRAKVLTSDAEIRQALVGNTISGVEKGKAFTEYLHPDGRITGEAADGRYTGHWAISGARMCLRYANGDGEEGGWDCSLIDIDGTQVMWSGDGKASVSRLTPGNPAKF